MQGLELIREASENTTFLGIKTKQNNAKSWWQLPILSCILQEHLQEKTWLEPSKRSNESVGGKKEEDVGCAVREVRAGRTREVSSMFLFLQIGKLRPKERKPRVSLWLCQDSNAGPLTLTLAFLVLEE